MPHCSRSTILHVKSRETGGGHPPSAAGGGEPFFEPTPADIAGISKSDLLLYTGDAMEPWAEKLIVGDLPDTVRAVDLSQGVALLAEEHEEEGHAHPFDPHIWTSPVNAMIMARTVVSALCEADPEGRKPTAPNGERYLANWNRLTTRSARSCRRPSGGNWCSAGGLPFTILPRSTG